jgi:type I restriction enzyme S subunit
MRYKLKDIFDLQIGKTPSRNNSEYWNTEDHKWISIADLTRTGKYISETKEYLSENAIQKSGIKVIPANTVVMSFKLSIGKTAITAEDMYSNEAIMAFLDKHVVEVLPEYILYMFKFKNWDEGSNEAVMGKTLNKAILSEIEIDICPIEEQRVIVDVLDKMMLALENRENELFLLDDLIKARFVEMFGDPVSNSNGLPESTLPELGEFGRGISKHRPRNDPKLLGGDYPLIQTGDVANAGLYITSYSSTYSELGLKQSKMWDNGTLCITIAANIAKTSILKFDACFPDSIVGFNANEKTNNIFIHYWFSFFQAILESQAPESAQKNINLKTLSELKVIVPVKDKQDKFVEFIKQVDKSKVIEIIK